MYRVNYLYRHGAARGAHPARKWHMATILAPDYQIVCVAASSIPMRCRVRLPFRVLHVACSACIPTYERRAAALERPLPLGWPIKEDVA
jgi:hypothetical protein